MEIIKQLLVLLVYRGAKNKHILEAQLNSQPMDIIKYHNIVLKCIIIASLYTIVLKSGLISQMIRMYAFPAVTQRTS